MITIYCKGILKTYIIYIYIQIYIYLYIYTDIHIYIGPKKNYYVQQLFNLTLTPYGCGSDSPLNFRPGFCPADQVSEIAQKWSAKGQDACGKSRDL